MNVAPASTSPFQLVAPYEPAGDQPQAIAELVEGLRNGLQYQTLLGVTGSGKTFTMANVIQQLGRPALVMSHNKVLAAQLYSEFREFFPHNAVGYFVSYYDYYQPEAYIPQTDTYIEKETTVNDELDRLRLAATTALMERRDVVIVASVSCIYGLGAPEEYRKRFLLLREGDTIKRQTILYRLVQLLYHRNDHDFFRGVFRAAGDTIDIFPAYGEVPVRVELFGDEIERVGELDHVTGRVTRRLGRVAIYPAKHYITSEERMKAALESIGMELEERLAELNRDGRLLEAERLTQRTRYDMEMLAEIGTCQGVENYSRHIDGREPGEAPYSLLDYFPEDYLVIVDESHMMLPQIRGMYAGDRSRKETLVKFGFRLPSALDNRPLKYEEFLDKVGQVVFVSATPAEAELELSDHVAEQIVRPTGLVDPAIEVRPATGQVDDLLGAIRERAERNERVLVTTLTRRMAEDLAGYLSELKVKVHYLHFQIDTIERVEIIESLRKGTYDVIVGVNLLREGLDLPEVTLVAILDADKEGFLRDERSLVQVCGRAARNVHGMVIMYADKPTGSMQRAIGEINRRRDKQTAYNQEHGIEPKTIQKALRQMLGVRSKQKEEAAELVFGLFDDFDVQHKHRTPAQRIADLKRRMMEAARDLEFEKAAVIRDRIAELQAELRSS